jgi:prepilin-type N-terminal cleavage/methylation domain-containing protein
VTVGRARARRGISLVEIMVAVTLLGILVTAHTLVTMNYAVQTRNVGLGVDRSAALSTAVDLYATRPFASIAADTIGGGCTRITAMTKFLHDRCIAITEPTQSITRVRIIIRPVDTALRPDTVYVDRSLPEPGSLFS